MKTRIISILVSFLFGFVGVAQAQEKMTVLLDWFLNPDHAPLLIAQEKGYFKNKNLTVEMIEPADPNDPPKLVAARRADVAVSYQPQLHIQVDQGLPLRRIGTLVASPLNSLVVLRDGPVKSIADLKGKTIGFSVGGFEDALLGRMLAGAGLTLKDVRLVNVNFALSQALLSGRAQAVVGAFRNFELNQLDIEKRPGTAFYPEEHGVPAYDELIYVAHADALRNAAHANKLSRFLDATEEGVTYLLNHPEESWELFIKGRPKLDNELNRRAFRDTLRRFAHAPKAFDPSRYERFARFLKDQGVIKNAGSADAYAVTLR